MEDRVDLGAHTHNRHDAPSYATGGQTHLAYGASRHDLGHVVAATHPRCPTSSRNRRSGHQDIDKSGPH